MLKVKGKKQSSLAGVISASIEGAVHVSLVRLGILIVCMVFSALALGVTQGSALAQEGVSEITISNVTGTDFTVSWISQAKEKGEVHFGTDPSDLSGSAFDIRGESIEDDLHYIKVSRLTKETSCYFTIISGGNTYNHDQQGSPFQVATGTDDPPPMPKPRDNIRVKVLQPNGEQATKAIIFMSIKDQDGKGSAGDSAEQSFLIWGSEVTVANFIAVNARTQDGMNFFQYSLTTDLVNLRAFGEGGCQTGTTLARAELSVCTGGKDNPAYKLELTCPTLPPPPVCACHDVRVSNISHAAATISWVSCCPAVGEVRYGEGQSSLGNTAYDQRGQNTASTTHYVPLTGLKPLTRYFYQVVHGGQGCSQDGQGCSQEGGQVCSEGSFTTGKALSMPGFNAAYGTVLSSTAVPSSKSGAIVYLSIQAGDGSSSPGISFPGTSSQGTSSDGTSSPATSSLLSALTNEEGFWLIGAGNARKQDLGDYFPINPADNLIIDVSGGTCCASLTTTLAQTQPASSIQLQDNLMCCKPPIPEICDGKDNNGDGNIDEGFDVGGSCTAGIGACQRTGTLVCKADGTGTECSAQPGQPQPEICDGLDNNCDGTVDEGLVRACASGTDQETCQNGIWSGCPVIPEICDGKDNDGDGLVDEDFADKGKSCTAGTGACQRTGTLVCKADGTGTECSARPGTAQTEVCDEQDNDCDGQTDELPNLQTQTDPANCGQCGYVCSYPHAAALCASGQCQMGDCDEGWQDADGDPANGCEHQVVSTCQIIPGSLRISNISAGAATISWFTDSNCPGMVIYSKDTGLASPLLAYDARGKEYRGTSHYVKISGLTSETVYYFEIQSADADGATDATDATDAEDAKDAKDAKDNNNGSYYTFTTCSSSMGVQPRILKGKVYLEDGVTPAEGAVVYVTIKSTTSQSYPLSSLVGANARWEVELRNLKDAADCTDFYWKAGNSIIIEAEGGKLGSGSGGTDKKIASGNPPGNQQDCGTVTLKALTIDYTLRLKAGYNLIALPLNPLADRVTKEETSFDSYSFLSAIPGCITVTAWDPDAQSYLTAYLDEDEGEPYGDRFAILPGQSYFVFVEKPVDPAFYGKASDSPIPIKLRSGYNLVSLIYGPDMPKDPSTGYTSYSILKEIPGLTVTDWDPDSQSYATAYWDEGEPSGALFNILVGRGFIVWVDKAGSWTPKVAKAGTGTSGASGMSGISGISGTCCQGGKADQSIDGKADQSTGIGQSKVTNPIISDIVISNVSAAAATISWFTDSDSPSVVLYSEDSGFTSPVAVYDVRGKEYRGTSHYVKISGLTPETVYYFEIQSTDAKDANGATGTNGANGATDATDSNRGSYYTFTTCSASMGVDPRILKGKVYRKDGGACQEDGVTPAEGPTGGSTGGTVKGAAEGVAESAAEGAIVYVTVKSGTNQSHLLSSLVGANARWEVELRNLKNAADCTDFSWKAGDGITLLARGGIGREVTGEMDIATGTLPQGCGDLMFP